MKTDKAAAILALQTLKDYCEEHRCLKIYPEYDDYDEERECRDDLDGEPTEDAPKGYEPCVFYDPELGYCRLRDDIRAVEDWRTDYDEK